MNYDIACAWQCRAIVSLQASGHEECYGIGNYLVKINIASWR